MQTFCRTCARACRELIHRRSLLIPKNCSMIATQRKTFTNIPGRLLHFKYMLAVGLTWISWASLKKTARCHVDSKEMAHVLSTLFPDLGPSPKEIDVIRVADMFYEHHKISELFQLLSAFKDSSNADVIWRLARVHYEMANAAESDAQKKQLMYEAFEAAKRALELDKNNFACHKWYAILLDEIGKFEGLKYRLQHSPEVRAHFERSLELNPEDPTSHHCLGYWHYTFADLPWYQRQAASAFFATPPTSTYEEAIKSFEYAEKVQPSFYSMNLLMLGKSYMKVGDNAKAAHYLRKLQNFNHQTVEDHRAKAEGAKLLDEVTRKLRQ